jgi:hypothetical protein
MDIPKIIPIYPQDKRVYELAELEYKMRQYEAEKDYMNAAKVCIEILKLKKNLKKGGR